MAIFVAPVGSTASAARPDVSLDSSALSRAGHPWPGGLLARQQAALAGPATLEQAARLDLLRAGSRQDLHHDRTAVRLYQRWLDAEPLSGERAEAMLAQAISALGSGTPGAALDILRRAGRIHGASRVADDLMFWEGEAAWKLEDREAANRALNRLLERYPGSPWRAQALYRLGWVDRERGDLEGAVMRFERAAILDDRLADTANLQRAWTLLELERYGQAEALFEHVERRSPGTGYGREAALGRAECRYRQEDFAGASELYNRALAGAEGPEARAAIRYSLAWTTLKKGQTERARDLFLELERDHPEDAVAPFAAYRAALCLLTLEKPKTARAALEDVQEKYPKHKVGEWSVYSGGWIELSLKRYHEAKAKFRSLLDLYPNGSLVAPARYLISAALYQERHYREAEREFLAFADVHAASGLADGALLWAGWAALLDGRPKEALGHLDRLASAFPGTEWRAEAAVAAGEAAFTVKDYDRARRDYLRASKAEGENRLRGLAGLGWCAFATGDWKEAEGRFRSVLNEATDSSLKTRARVRLADALFNQKRYADAVPQYRKVLSGKSSRFARWAQLQIGWCAYRQEQPDEARANWNQLRRRWPKSDEAPAALMAIGETLFHQEKFGEAEAAFRKLAEDEPATSELARSAMLRIGDCRYNAKDYERAIIAYRSFTRTYPKSDRLSEALFGMQWAYLQLGEYEKARREAGAFLEKFPQSTLGAEVHLMVAESFRREGKSEDALAQYHEFLEAYPASDLVAAVLIKMGQAQEDLGQHEKAAGTYGTFLAKHPEHPLAVTAAFRLGVTRYARGDVPGAVEMFESVAGHGDDPLAPEALYNLVLCHKQSGDEDAMAAAVERLVGAYPQTRAAAQGRLVLGYALADGGKTEAAQVQWRAAAASPIKPVAAEAAYALGEMRADRGDPEAALASFLAGAADLKGGGEWAVQCAFAAANELAVKGRHGEAVERFRSVLELEQPEPGWRATAYFGIGQQYDATGKLGQARLMYRKCLDEDPPATLRENARKRLRSVEERISAQRAERDRAAGKASPQGAGAP